VGCPGGGSRGRRGGIRELPMLLLLLLLMLMLMLMLMLGRANRRRL
jgi:hypothetical protein